MSSVSQTIPNYIFGINEQPDYLKRPGQVRDSLNMTPDVTKGLIKRPGSRFVCNVEDDADGKWFNYYRTETEQYIGHIQTNGFVRVWNADGTQATVTQLSGVTDSSTGANYLQHTDAEDIQTLTVNDYTFLCNRNTTVAYTNDLSATPPNEGLIELKVIAYGRNYTVDFKNSSGTALFSATINTTADSTQVINSDTILNDLVSDINGQSNFTATRIGNTIHVVNSAASFTMETSDVTLLSCFTDQVNNVERLPYQCHHGYVVKIVNSNSEEDDYYAVFQGKDDVDGSGVWQETVGWNRLVNNAGVFQSYSGINTTLDNTTMPHVLICTALNTFTVAAADGATPSAATAMSYSTREVGDLGTNPDPSFVGSQINQMLLFRNRIAFLTGENVVMTTSGGLRPVNFFSTSALTSLATDPIDVSAASKEPALLWDGIEINNGLILFAENQQYLMTTDSDLLTQETTKLNAISYYPYSRQCSPFSLGTTVAFIDNSGSNSRMFEMSNISRDTEPTVIEQSKPISRVAPNNITNIADSRESSLILFSTNDTGIEDEVFGYKYFQDGPERQLSSWFRWQLPGDVLYHCVMRDKYYVVVRYESNNRILVLDLQDTTDTAFVSFENEEYQVHMDNRVTVPAADLTYNSATDETTFDMVKGDVEGPTWSDDVTGTVSSSGTTNSITTLFDGDTSTIFKASGGTSLTIDWQSATAVQYQTLDVFLDAEVSNVNYKSVTTSTSGAGWLTIASTAGTLDSNDDILLTSNVVGETPGIAAIRINGNRIIRDGFDANREDFISPTHKDIYAYVTNTGNDQGRFSQVSWNTTPEPSVGTLKGDWSGQDIQLGYLFNSSVTVPQFYLNRPEGNSVRSNTRNNLTLHRLFLETGAIGVTDYTLERKGKDNYVGTIEGVRFDEYDANDPLLSESLRTYIPVYERNTNVVLKLHSEHPSPFSLFSISWEGDASNRYYQSA